MEMLEVEVFSHAVNSPVIRMPGRRFPGIVIQGDSLHHMSTLAREIHRISRKLKAEQLLELTADLEKLLADKMDHYERTLKSHRAESPY